MDHSLAFYIVTICAVLLTGISKSGFGGGLGILSVPMMSMFVAPQFAVAVLMPVLLLMDILVAFKYRNQWSPLVIKSLLPGALVGLAIGAVTFQWMDASTIKFAVAVLAIFFVTQNLLGRTRAQQSKGHTGTVSSILGALSGFASYVAHAGGPPVKGYLLIQNLEKSVFVGTNTIFFFSLNVIKSIGYGATGVLSFQSLAVSMAVAPFLLLGVFTGIKLHKYIDENLFKKIVFGALLLTAAKLLSDSLPHLYAQIFG
ncbi:sulfite exporter TauE/SafE family protein [Ruegeria lacuscaerulensis]|uniref:sulfite exporter TauE/SafE family protein n=1 Tax=Ruegeria lacuscaerulensis TaxID=55218 RepID=UPI00147B8122|nr:sulfite exporter TauE/SafE family protein [Ruegeria lacuscaerulensis]